MLTEGKRQGPFYKVLLPYTRGKSLPSLFGTDDEDVHRALKRPIAGIFSMSNLVTFEPYVDDTIRLLLAQLDRRFASEKPEASVCDLGHWLQYFAFDVMGELTFSRKFGFLDRGADVDGVMGSIWKHFKAAAPVTQMPWIDRFWNKNPLLVRFWPSTASPIMAFAAKRVAERRAVEKSWAAASEANPRDFLSRFVEAQATDPSVPDWAVTVWVFSNITAGSDSTAAVLRCLWYHLLRNEDTMQRLREELDEAARRGQLSQPCKWSEVRELPYLAACVKEGIRMHAPFGLPLERVVPAGGATISGKHLPGGTVIGMSGWVANRHRPTFGEDADEWNPGRWLVGDEERRKRMEASIMTVSSPSATPEGRGRRLTR
ncbi:Cytochrome P450 [Macrophomina phaseolina MS6]|uniref:Cytochrome P450 n=1 Tax=Macrophomina phaseolina (strain MS6) TaxID=1126212 RepID=K2S104_MACPH|nr:Cytochrome P450 [Macrophomina phaseolina MS6]